MKKIFVLFIFLTVFFKFLFSQKNCYTIVVGANASTTGSVIVGHNEDDKGDFIVNIYKVPSKKYDKTGFYKTIDNIEIPFKKKTASYLWFETTQHYFGDLFLNQWGVSVCSNASASKEKNAQGNIGYDLRKIIAEKAISAKSAVIIAGNLIDSLGYASSGRTYCIADAYEAWILSVVKGKKWIAQKVPDDEVVIIPNYYIIDTVNFKDSLNFIFSDSLKQYAIEKKWYNPDYNDIFSFREVYGSKKSLQGSWNIHRHIAGLNFLSSKKYLPNQKLPFSFKPAKKISKKDIQKVLIYHYENTKFELNKNKFKNPHQNKIHTICNKTTKFSIIFELHNTYPENNQNVVWYAPCNPCINPYLPIAFSIDSIPPEFYNRNWNEDISKHFDLDKNKIQANPLHAYSIFYKRNSKIDKNYWQEYDNAKKLKQKYEEKIEKRFKGYNKNELSYKILQEYYNEILKL